MNRGGGKAGAPETSSNNNSNAAQELPLPHEVEGPSEFDGTTVPGAWLGDLQRRATQPLRTASEYDRAIAACLAVLAAEQQQRPSKYALSSSALGPQHWAWLVALLLLLLLLWLGSA